MQLHGSRCTRNAIKALFSAFESQNTLGETQKLLGNYRIRELAVGTGVPSCFTPADGSEQQALSAQQACIVSEWHVAARSRCEALFARTDAKNESTQGFSHAQWLPCA